MASFSTKFFTFFMLSFLACSVHGQVPFGLSTDLYDESCPTLLSIVQEEMKEAIDAEKRMAASILRLMFHDCFVDGCNGGPLLDVDPSAPDGNSEKNASPNKDSLRGFDVIDAIKTRVETECEPEKVSCADILVLAAREGVKLLAPEGTSISWEVPFGRKDTVKANPQGAETDLPSPSSSFLQLFAAFQRKDFSPAEMVTLSGAHTIGQARCSFFNGFPTVVDEFCSNGEAPIDYQTPDEFDNEYYTNLVEQKGFFHSDQEIYDGTPLTPLDAILLAQARDDAHQQIEKYSEDGNSFVADFGKAMEKLGNMVDNTATEIRLNCRAVNAIVP